MSCPHSEYKQLKKAGTEGQMTESNIFSELAIAKYRQNYKPSSKIYVKISEMDDSKIRQIASDERLTLSDVVRILLEESLRIHFVKIAKEAGKP